jgi:ABC-type maltose transport system permease subunit
MGTAMSATLGGVMAVTALLGLFLASRSLDAGFEFFGLSLFLFGTGLNFWLIKRYYDSRDRRE